MRRGMLITVSGTDCSGKSTQIELLEAALRERGDAVRRFWFRPGYSEEMDAVRAFVRQIRPGAIPRAGHSAEREEVFARPGVSRAWVAMALVDSLVQYVVKVRAWLWRGQTVICDRYIWDGELDLQLRFPDLEHLYGPALAAVQRLAPKPDAAFLLTLPYDVATVRAEAKNEPFPDREELRRIRWECYDDMAQRPELIALDATRSIDDIQREMQTRCAR